MLGSPGIRLLFLPASLGPAWPHSWGRIRMGLLIMSKGLGLRAVPFEAKTNPLFPLLRGGSILGGASSGLGSMSLSNISF